MLIHPYQTLVREIATPTVPAFFTACIALVKSPKAGELTDTPLSVVETICDALAVLVPLFNTTSRPFSSQIKSAIRPYIAPTESDRVVVPFTLQRAARKLATSLHHVAAKSGGSDEWAKLIDTLLKDLHLTADQVLRAVTESWDGSDGYGKNKVDLDDEPHGGGSSPGDLPPWSGTGAGAERLIGLFHYLSDCLRYPTKAPVTIPISALVDAAARVFLIARLSPKSQSWDQALQTNGAIGREEREELWSHMPDIHLAALDLLQVMVQRLGDNMIALVPEVLDHLARVFKSGINLTSVRTTGYRVLKEILVLAGPTLPKSAVDTMDPLLGACCRDLQQDAGHLQEASNTTTAPSDSKKNGVLATNADLFLQPQTSAVVDMPTLDSDHKAAATALLAIIPSNLPQRHLKPSVRGLVDQTAILTHNRDAMLASVLNPYKDQRGRIYPSVLPHLTQQFPDDKGLEILRTNLRAGAQSLAEGEVPLEELTVEDDEDEDVDMREDNMEEDEATEKSVDAFKPGKLPTFEKDLPIQSNPFEVSNKGKDAAADLEEDVAKRATSPPKRKHEGSDAKPSKRQVVKKAPTPPPAVAAPIPAPEEGDADEDDDDESVHLNMELEDDEDEDEE